jgi:serine/threonine protein phosphatase 1
VTPSLPQGQLVYAVGDIHGRADLLQALLRQIEDDARSSADAKTKTLVFLGDYVDRGPDSADVVETLINRLPQNFETHFLKGNHEALLLGFLYDASLLLHWLMNGGGATMASYGVDVEGLEGSRARPGTWREAFAAAIPATHVRFCESLKLGVSIGDYHFVHAGVRPGIPLDAQTEADLIWIRKEFLDYPDPFGKVVVHGHTPGNTPDVRANRIGIDTGAFFTGRLTALRLEDGSQKFLQT